MTTQQPGVPVEDDGGRPFVRQVALDCAHPRPFAEFDRELLGYHYTPGDEPPPAGEPDPVGEDWLVLRPDPDDPSSGRGLAFQQSDDHRPPEWNAGSEPLTAGAQRQMIYLDMTVPDAGASARQRDRAVSRGATILFGRSAGRTATTSRSTSSPTSPATPFVSSSPEIFLA